MELIRNPEYGACASITLSRLLYDRADNTQILEWYS